MENIGSYIQQLRIEKNLSLDDVADKTRLKIYMIIDIENNIFGAFDNLGHAKIFLNTLIKCLNGDQKIAFDLLEKEFSQKTVVLTSLVKHKRQNKIMLSSNFFYAVFLVIFIIILSSVVIYFYNQGKLSFGELKKSFELNKDTKQENKDVKVNVVPTDSVWEKQNQVLKTKSDGSTNKIQLNNAQVIYDTTDYIGDILFKRNESPLNPTI